MKRDTSAESGRGTFLLCVGGKGSRRHEGAGGGERSLDVEDYI